MSEHKPRRFGSTGLFPQPLGKMIGVATLPATRKRGFVHAKLLAEWDQIAGPLLAAIATPLEVRFPPNRKNQGTVVLSVASVDAPLVQHQEGLLLEKFAFYFGYRAIDRVTLRHRPAPPAPRPSATTSQRPALRVTPPLDDLPDGELKEALASLAATLTQPPGA